MTVHDRIVGRVSYATTTRHTPTKIPSMAHGQWNNWGVRIWIMLGLVVIAGFIWRRTRAGRGVGDVGPVSADWLARKRTESEIQE